MKHNNGASIFLPSILTKIKIVPLLFGRIEIEELSVSNVAIQPYFESENDTISINSIGFSPEKIPLSIQNLNLEKK